MEKISYLGHTLTRWQVGPSTFLAMPEKGARLMNWHLTLGDGSVRDVIYWPELSVLDDIAKVRGGNPILFPFCGRTFDGGTINCWRDGNGIRRPMPEVIDPGVNDAVAASEVEAGKQAMTRETLASPSSSGTSLKTNR